MKKTIFAAGTAVILLNGCQYGFFAVSASGGSDGGVYHITPEECVMSIAVPGMNYLIPGEQAGRFFATSMAGITPGSKDGSVAVLFKKGDFIQLLQRVSVEGKTPCHLTLSPDGKFLYTANYSSGNISEFQITGDGELLRPPRLIEHSGRSISRRQTMPHPHFTGFHPDGKQLFVCDLGTDQIWIYQWSDDGGIALPCAGKLQLPPGSGPRYLVWAPDGKILYVANELNSTVSSFVRCNGKWQLHHTASTLIVPKPKNYPGAIKITADGKFFLVTNRGDDSIALFSADGKGGFQLQQNIPAGGKYPSDILLLPDDRLAVVNLKSGNLCFFAFDRKNAALKLLDRRCSIPKAIGLCPE